MTLRAYRDDQRRHRAAIAQTVLDSAFIRGPAVDAFERAFALVLGVKHCVSCANGTDALYIAFRASACSRATRSSPRLTRGSPRPRP